MNFFPFKLNGFWLCLQISDKFGAKQNFVFVENGSDYRHKQIPLNLMGLIKYIKLNLTGKKRMGSLKSIETNSEFNNSENSEKFATIQTFN